MVGVGFVNCSFLSYGVGVLILVPVLLFAFCSTFIGCLSWSCGERGVFDPGTRIVPTMVSDDDDFVLPGVLTVLSLDADDIGYPAVSRFGDGLWASTNYSIQDAGGLPSCVSMLAFTFYCIAVWPPNFITNVRQKYESFKSMHLWNP